MADILIGSALTNENGLAAFTGLPFGTYKYVQTGVTTGHTQDSTEYTITIPSATLLEEDHTNSSTEIGTIMMTKHVAGFPGYVLPGATFKFIDSNGKPPVSVSPPMDSTGTLTSPNVMSITGIPQTYQLTEVAAPDGYEVDTAEYDVEVDAGQTVGQSIPNIPSAQGILDTTLTDTNYTEYDLEGSNYNLYLATPQSQQEGPVKCRPFPFIWL